jgi:plasmid stabilization system protein ParE
LAEINWTEESEIWLKDIHDHIAADNPEAAARTVDGIYQRAQLLKQHTQIGHKYETESSRNVRILLYGHYRITYLLRMATSIFSESFTARWILIGIYCKHGKPLANCEEIGCLQAIRDLISVQPDDIPALRAIETRNPTHQNLLSPCSGLGCCADADPGAAHFATLRACPWLPSAAPPALAAR